MIVSTTHSIDGFVAVKYMSPVSVSLVLGTAILLDDLAAASDFLGGKSRTYQRQLEALFKEATEELGARASAMGANAAIGARFDLSEISGRGKQMFMLNAVATPVILKTPADRAADEVRASEDARRLLDRQTEFSQRLASYGLLEDTETAEKAEHFREVYGDRVYVNYLNQIARERGIAVPEFRVDDVPPKGPTHPPTTTPN